MENSFDSINDQLILEAVPNPIIIVDESGVIVAINKRTEVMFGYEKEELLGHKMEMLLPDKYKKNHVNLRASFNAAPSTRSMGSSRELYALTKSGNEVAIEIGLNPMQKNDHNFVLASIIDITERKEAEERFSMVVENAPNAMILVDEVGKIVMVNLQTELLLGYDRTELIGKEMEILVPNHIKGHHVDLREKYNEHPQTRSMGEGRDLYALKKNGSEVAIEIGLNPIRKKNKTFVLASIINITERKVAQEAQNIYTKEIEEKNDELENFTNVVAHDLRDPISSIVSLVDVMMAKDLLEENEDLNSYLEVISNSSSRMLNLVEGLYAYSRLGKKADLKLIDINTVIKEVLIDLDSKIKSSQAVIDIEKMPTVIGYEVELRLLFQNLISNAIKYKRSGIAPKIKIEAIEENHNWKIAINDNGIGIDQENLDKIFLIFERLHKSDEYDGIGIGLANCKKIADLHNGKIWVDSELGVGSTFYFSILKTS